MVSNMLGSSDFGLRVDVGLVYLDVIELRLFSIRAHSIRARSVSDIMFPHFSRVSVEFRTDRSGLT